MTANKRNKPRARSHPKSVALQAQKRAEQLTQEFSSKRKAGTLPVPVDEPAPRPKRDRVPPKPITDELIERLVKRDLHRQEHLIALAEQNNLQARWSHKQGTPETHERLSKRPSRQHQSPLVRMFRLGKIEIDDLVAAEQIAQVVEMIESGVSVRTSKFEDMVDCAGSAHNPLVEGLMRIRAEVAYTEWRERLHHPKRMVIDMIVSDVPFVQQAHRYGMQWRTARKRLISALRIWRECLERAVKSVDIDDIQAVYRRMGERF